MCSRLNKTSEHACQFVWAGKNRLNAVKLIGVDQSDFIEKPPRIYSAPRMSESDVFRRSSRRHSRQSGIAPGAGSSAKDRRPVQFELTEPTRSAVGTWLEKATLRPEQCLFPSRLSAYPHISTRQYDALEISEQTEI
ncbi:hypothetical protein PSAC2689_90001 [Paraburkholderia sacchari]